MNHDYNNEEIGAPGQPWVRKSGGEPMRIRNNQGVTWLTFPPLEACSQVTHGFSTRTGGVSQGHYGTMNFSFSRGDDPQHVLENYRRMAEVLGVLAEKMVVSFQTHTTNIRVVTAADEGKGVFRQRDYRDVDGMVTNVPGITLVTFYADCVPLYFYDPEHQAIGLSHSGWRGTVNRMGLCTLQAMNREYGTRPEQVIACIGPSICQDCFEVGQEVADAFGAEFDSQHHGRLFYRKPDGKYQLDLWEANRIVLEEAGVAPARIHVTDICTRCNPDHLYSHRLMGEQRGNLAAFLCLVPDPI